MNFADDFFATMEPRLQKAYAAMQALECGDIANPDEKRMVGHYWLRNSALAPTPEMRQEIDSTVAAIKAFATEVHRGGIKGAKGPFKNVLVIGIGGSALGPQFVAQALGQPAADKMDVFFFDNTDPDGMDKVLAEIGTETLGETLTVVISKSGGTKETRNGMLEAQAAYERAGLKFAQHAVAVTGNGQRTRPGRHEEQLAAPLPDVGLGRRPHERTFRRRPVARRAARARHRRDARRRAGLR